MNADGFQIDVVAHHDRQDILRALGEPFDPATIDWRPGATNKEKTRGMALAYVDPRHYYARLNEAVGLNWQDEYKVQIITEPVSGKQIVYVLCELSVDGTMRTGDGEEEVTGPNPRTMLNAQTKASAMAFKRACVKFGLGAYLYQFDLPWEELDQTGKKFTPAAINNLNATAVRLTDALFPLNGPSSFRDRIEAADNDLVRLAAIMEDIDRCENQYRAAGASAIMLAALLQMNELGAVTPDNEGQVRDIAKRAYLSLKGGPRNQATETGLGIAKMLSEALGAE